MAESTKKKTEKKDTVTIYIPKVNAKQEDLPVTINGKRWIIKRGVRVEVPAYIADVVRQQERMMQVANDFIEAKSK